MERILEVPSTPKPSLSKHSCGLPAIRTVDYKTLTTVQRKWLKRRQAIEPAIGHVKHDHRMDRCWLKGEQRDALHAVLCAAGFNIRWLMRATARLGLAAVHLRLQLLALIARSVWSRHRSHCCAS